MSDTELCYLTAAEARLRFENHSLSPVELMQALIKRSERVQGG